jgi:hypothetical protein
MSAAAAANHSQRRCSGAVTLRSVAVLDPVEH